MWDPNSVIRDQTHSPCVGRQSPNHRGSSYNNFKCSITYKNFVLHLKLMEYLKSAIPNYKCIFFPLKKNMKVPESPLPSHLWSQNLQVWGQEPVSSPCPVLQATSVSSVCREERLLAEDLKKGRCGSFEHSEGWHAPTRLLWGLQAVPWSWWSFTAPQHQQSSFTLGCWSSETGWTPPSVKADFPTLIHQAASCIQLGDLKALWRQLSWS